MAGLPGTGKSALAKALVARLDGVVLNKDDVRSVLFPGALTDFSREQDDLVFDAILRAAGYLAGRGRVQFIFLDGRTFSRREQIERAIHAAEEAGCAWKILLAVCPDTVAESRLIAGAAEHPAANRTVEMYREMKARFAPIIYPHLEIDTSQSLEICVERGLRYLGADR
jgi:predicted kinase